MVYNQAGAAQLLIEKGCDTSILNSRGKTAWDLADAFTATDIQSLFESSTHSMLVDEKARRQHRPDVSDTFRDDIQLDYPRLSFWDIDKFEGWKQLAEGGFGVVYGLENVSPAVQLQFKIRNSERGEHMTRHFSHMALKAPKPDFDDGELKAEVESLSKLAHQNVVAILGMVEGASPINAEKSWMMCLEYCESDLRRFVRTGAGSQPSTLSHSSSTATTTHSDMTPTEECSVELLAQLCTQIVDGMAYVHSQTVLQNSKHMPMRHLDLKPENILLAKSDQDTPWVAKVADFGWRPDIAPEEWTGTSHYMAPEFAVVQGLLVPPPETASQKEHSSAEEVGQAADVFSFGVMLWELIGRFDVDQWKFGWKLRASDFPAGFPPKLKLLVEACWALSPAERPTFTQLQRLLAQPLGWFASQTVSAWLKQDLGVSAGVECFDGYIQGELEGLSVDSSEFTAFLEDDDLAEYLEEIAEEIAEDEREAFVAGMTAKAAEMTKGPATGGQEQQAPRERLLTMIGGGDDEVTVLREDNGRLREENAALKAALKAQVLQQPGEGLPPNV